MKRAKDDLRYNSVSQDESFWNMTFLILFLPEAVYQNLIGLSWSVPFRVGNAGAVAPPSVDDTDWLNALALGLYSVGWVWKYSQTHKLRNIN